MKHTQFHSLLFIFFGVFFEFEKKCKKCFKHCQKWQELRSSAVFSALFSNLMGAGGRQLGFYIYNCRRAACQWHYPLTDQTNLGNEQKFLSSFISFLCKKYTDKTINHRISSLVNSIKDPINMSRLLELLHAALELSSQILGKPYVVSCVITQSQSCMLGDLGEDIHYYAEQYTIEDV